MAGAAAVALGAKGAGEAGEDRPPGARVLIRQGARVERQQARQVKLPPV
jgi:hypothetical protein